MNGMNDDGRCLWGATERRFVEISGVVCSVRCLKRRPSSFIRFIRVGNIFPLVTRQADVCAVYDFCGGDEGVCPGIRRDDERGGGWCLWGATERRFAARLRNIGGMRSVRCLKRRPSSFILFIRVGNIFQLVTRQADACAVYDFSCGDEIVGPGIRRDDERGGDRHFACRFLVVTA
jgi:hypothetical protein